MVMYMKKNIFSKILSALLMICSVTFLIIIFCLDLLPSKYFAILSIIVIFFTGFNVFLVNVKKLKKKIKKVISVFMILAIIAMGVASFYASKTMDVLKNNGDTKYKLENYSVMVLKDSKYNKIDDIKNEQVGYFENSTGSKKACNKLLKKVKVDFKNYNSSDKMVSDLLEKNINVILIEDSIKNILMEEIENFEETTKVIYSFSVKVKSDTEVKNVDVTKKPFAIYISGIDTYGEISSVSRSDVNIVMVVNPKIHQILLISIPRDYYVQLHGTTGTRDKLTHAGIYGVDMSIHTIEDLLDMEINYYIKVNFTSVIDIVNALGGLDVYSEYTFVSYSNYSFKKGMNKVNGEEALDFARTRKAFVEGDRQRGKNQQALIEAIVRKATSKSVITKYNSLLDAVNGKYQTNMPPKKITSLIKMQLNDMSSWNITSYSLTGSDANDYTYTYNQLLYVMKPNEESVTEAINLIDKVLGDENLDSSYNEIGGDSNNVSKVATKPQSTNAPKSETKETPKETPKEDPEEKSKETPIEEETVDETGKSEKSDDTVLDPIVPNEKEQSENQSN